MLSTRHQSQLTINQHFKWLLGNLYQSCRPTSSPSRTKHFTKSPIFPQTNTLMVAIKCTWLLVGNNLWFSVLLKDILKFGQEQARIEPPTIWLNSPTWARAAPSVYLPQLILLFEQAMLRGSIMASSLIQPCTMYEGELPPGTDFMDFMDTQVWYCYMNITKVQL